MGADHEETAVRERGGNGGAVDQIKEDLVGLPGFLSTLQDRAVPAFYAERADLDQGIRPCFEDDADDADGDRHAAECEPLVELVNQIWIFLFWTQLKMDKPLKKTQ